MITNTKRWIETHATHLFFATLILGILTPGFEKTPAMLPAWILGGVIFFACSNITLSSIKSINLCDAIIFYVLRFLLLPLAVYAAFSWIYPTFSISSLLLTALPSGTSSSALTLIAGGNTAFSLGITVVSGLLSPFTVPALMNVAGTNDLHLDTFGMFSSMAQIIFVPMGLYFLIARRIKPVREWSQKNTKWLSTSLTAITLFIVVAMQRDEFLKNIPFLAENIAISIFVFFIIFIFGLVAARGKDHPLKIATIISSVIMNNALGISIALLYFPTNVSIFMVLSEIPWVLSVSFLQRFLKEKSP
jgi:BASS family bile acid:Na+ symporter